MKINKRIVTIVIAIMILFGFFTLLDTRADVADKPDFDLQLTVSKTEALVGEDVIINGVLTPKPFQITAPPKEIVLVLDTSGSMDDEINIDTEEICTNKRVTYCTTHEKSNNHSDWWSEHNWVSDYCVECGKVGEHNKIIQSTKIEELKKAANNFIEKMKNVPNLKIGIVTYESSGAVKRTEVNKKNIAFIPASEEEKLKGIIGSLDASGGTNTGDGLRRAVWLLNSSGEQNAMAKKTIVLMSDGIPTFYSKKSYNNNEYYLDITSETGGISYDSGSGNSDTNDLKDLGYAKEIGAIIQTKGYSAFTIGYGMDDIGIDRMRQLHSSMISGKSGETSSDDNEVGFYPTSDGAIDGVFDSIAEKILNSYDLNNVKMDITFNEGFSLNVAGNTVNVGNITYRKADEKDGKITYNAEQVKFSFIVKGTEIGYKNINSKLVIRFPWDGKEEVKNFDSIVSINILPNQLPTISASLIGDKEITSNIGEEVFLQYKINAHDFEYNDSSNMIPNDVIIVIDNAKKNGVDVSTKLNIIKNSVIKEIFNNSVLKSANTQYGIITYSNQSSVISNLTNDIDKLSNDIGTITVSNNSSKNLKKTFDEIINMLNSSRQNSKKNIIFISEGTESNPDSYIEDFLNSTQNIKTNFITFAIDTTSGTSNMKDFHNKINSTEDKYFNIEGQANNLNNSINNTIIDISNKIVNDAEYKPYTIPIKLYFNLNDNFNIGKNISESSGKYVVNGGSVTYRRQSDGRYIADPIADVNFSVFGKENKNGKLTFGEDRNLNFIAYEKLLGGTVNITVETPIINIEAAVSNLSHGLYGGVKNIDGVDIVDIIESNNGFETAAGSDITFGAKFLLAGNNTKFNLNIDSKLDDVLPQNINVYKVIKTNNKITLEKLNANINSTNLNDNNFDITISDVNSNAATKSEIVVIYDVKVNENSKNEQFINTIKFSNDNIKDAKIYTIDKSLPDLF